MTKETEKAREAREAWAQGYRTMARLEALMGMPAPLCPAATRAGAPTVPLARAGAFLPAPPAIDTIALERELVERHGPWKGSMADLIGREYGPEAVRIIAENIEHHSSRTAHLPTTKRK